MEELPPRQRELLDFVASFTDQKGIPPTLREIGEAMGIRSTNGVSDQVKALIKKGYLERVGDARTSRGIRVTHSARGGFRDNSTVAVPVIGRVAAGSPILAEENYAGTLHMDATTMPHQAPVFALVIHGNSMIDDGILDGDYVFVRQQSEARNGDIVVAMVDGDATCKRFFRERGRVRLQPANVDMSDIIVDASRQFSILGVVVGVYRRIHA
ncbi:MAG: transcriptional repressor LexA [Deltaproteobacteria bacterium]|nr:transcriptional repressor LexA [Deltaproteobacteria bacterium]